MGDDEFLTTIRTKMPEWFSWAEWSAEQQGPYCCVWATVKVGRVVVGGFVIDQSTATERVARCKTWRAALIAAKKWAWKQKDAAR